MPGPNALTSVSRPEPGWQPGPQEIKYTAFNKVSSIVDTAATGKTLSYSVYYGLDDQRRKSVFKDSGQVIRTKHYFGDYERINENSTIKNYHYISSPTGLCAIFVTEGSGTQGQVWHAYTDHLGSLTYMVNADNSNDYKEYSYDPWGNPRDAADWTDTLSTPLFAGRGFTGHEHLAEFALIDMNGRIYDPMLGRFFSPDPYVQLPGYAGSYNRYSYALNNPLKYNDPDGNFLLLTMSIGYALMQADIAGKYERCRGGNYWNAFGNSIGISAASMVLGAWMGSLTNTLNIAGTIPGALWGAGTTYITGGITSIAAGGRWNDGAVLGAITGGIVGGYDGYKLATKYGWNKLTGGMSEVQRDIWYNYKAGNLNERETVALLNGESYDLSGSPDVKIISVSEKNIYDEKTGEIIGQIYARGSTVGLDAQGNEIGIFEASHIPGGVNSRIYMGDNLTGKQFIKTSYHELVHAQQFYTGEFYSKRLNFSNLSEKQIRYGLVLYAESWAYGNTALRYGDFSKYNRIVNYWHSWYYSDYSWYKYIHQ